MTDAEVEKQKMINALLSFIEVKFGYVVTNKDLEPYMKDEASA